MRRILQLFINFWHRKKKFTVFYLVLMIQYTTGAGIIHIAFVDMVITKEGREDILPSSKEQVILEILG